jgi:hypothetical protein
MWFNLLGHVSFVYIFTTVLTTALEDYFSEHIFLFLALCDLQP